MALVQVYPACIVRHPDHCRAWGLALTPPLFQWTPRINLMRVVWFVARLTAALFFKPDIGTPMVAKHACTLYRPHLPLLVWLKLDVLCAYSHKHV